MQTLVEISAIVQFANIVKNKQAYSVPVIKRAANATFSLSGNCNFRTTAIGRNIIPISVTMVSEEYMRTILATSIHFPPVIVTSQFLAIGWQL